MLFLCPVRFQTLSSRQAPPLNLNRKPRQFRLQSNLFSKKLIRTADKLVENKDGTIKYQLRKIFQTVRHQKRKAIKQLHVSHYQNQSKNSGQFLFMMGSHSLELICLHELQFVKKMVKLRIHNIPMSPIL